MNIDQLIYDREQVRLSKNYKQSDEIRDILDAKNVFVFDGKDGQEVWHLTESFFMFKDRRIETCAMSRRRYVEYMIKREIAANNNFDAWITSNLKY